MNDLNIKKIATDGISYLKKLEGSDLYFGIDHCGDDLYEAKELYNLGHHIDHNRLVFVSYPEGEISEPLIASHGQYFADPVFDEGYIFILKADFGLKKLYIYRSDQKFRRVTEHISLDMDEKEDCYNMRLTKYPLTLIKTSKEQVFQILWPLRSEFQIGPHESFDHRIDEYLIFSEWFEDPDYREEAVIRRYPDGEKLWSHKGSILTMDDGQEWLIG